LSLAPSRGPRAELDGFVFVPRLIEDDCRAFAPPAAA
jgi:hypothetical protein